MGKNSWAGNARRGKGLPRWGWAGVHGGLVWCSLVVYSSESRIMSVGWPYWSKPNLVGSMSLKTDPPARSAAQTWGHG